MHAAIVALRDAAIVALRELEQALVGNVPYTFQEQDIGEFFHQCGVTDVYLVKDRDTGDMKVNEQPNTDKHRPCVSCTMLASGPHPPGYLISLLNVMRAVYSA